MKTIQKEQKSFYNVYVATDGTEFKNEDECRKYEESANGVVSARYKDLIVKTDCENDIIGCGCEDDRVDVVSVRTEAEYDIVLQMLLLDSPYLTYDEHKDRLDRNKAVIRKALDEKDVLLINRGYELDNFWIMGTRNSLKEEIDKFCTPVEKKDDNA